MDWNKVFGYISNIVTVAAIAGILLFIVLQVPEADYTGNAVSVGLGGLIGYLKGISTNNNKS